ncbi:serine/threonine-protein kinase RIO3 [Toxorhynchites rutilus septentrionalis]|uniref:serine/threonine-protein kinase RIO3 n=1 Tax=Toxorhynchites rutilus septentrionalis TaxID=329112 RepID=UPI0024797D91|nr:serine/threonine-protein kinase RIO3 [Toxorhynchites rutilus septentrionalis]
MSSPWGKIKSVETVDFSEIMSEEFARDLHERDKNQISERRLSESFRINNANDTVAGCSRSYNSSAVGSGSEVDESFITACGSAEATIPEDVLRAIEEADNKQVESDAEIAKLLQAQFDYEYDGELKREEDHRNKNSRVKISLKNYRMIPEGLLYDEAEEKPLDAKTDWDRFETNEKELKGIPRTGYKVNKQGEMVTKHNSDISGRKNACKVMSFPPEFSTGDGAGFDMKLSNTVFNQLKTHSKKSNKKHNKAHDRKENIATAEMGLDEPTRLILYKWINNQLLDSIDGIISTGKEAVILHGQTDPTNPNLKEGEVYPTEIAIKIFSTTLNQFKQRDRYIKDDFRFAGRFSKQNAKTVINMWAEKELHNLNRMKKYGILCPEIVTLKNNILVMSFIGENSIPAPKLKEADLNEAQLICAYEEIVEIMHKLYNEARLVHADFSEYNILWFNEQCWIIDVAQSVEPGHPGALEFLMRDCDNISTFFSKKGVTGVKSKEDLFFHITGLDPLTHNATILERIHMKGQPAHIVAAVDDNTPDHFKPVEYPFDYAWKKVEQYKKSKKGHQEIGNKCKTDAVKIPGGTVLPEENIAA